MSKSPLDYQRLQAELDDIIASLDNPEIDLDQAIKRYQQGMTIIKQLQDYLKIAANKVERVKARF